MNRTLTVCSLLLVAGCSSSSSNNSGGDDASDGASQTDDSSNNADVTTQETGADAPTDSMQSGDASDGGARDAEAGTDGAAGDGEAGTADGEAGPPACGAPWTDAPPVVAALALPDGGTVLLHAAGSGSQDYACTGTFIDGGVDGGDAGETFAWVLTGPDAGLKDCTGAVIGHHFPSEAGAAAPEWMTFADGTYVIGKKVGAYTPDGGSGSVPWLLLQATSHGGTGTLSNVTYVQRLNTDGGVAPSSCDPADASTLAVPYTADYYFFGP